MFLKALARVLPISDSRKTPNTYDEGQDVADGEHSAEERAASAVFPVQEQGGAIALLAALEALAPVTRASFLALRQHTDLPDASLLRALMLLENAGLVEVEDRPVGSSARSFSLSERGREVLCSPREGAAIEAPKSAARSGGATGGPLGLVEGTLPAGALDAGAQA